jgi:hypothetical protein
VGDFQNSFTKRLIVLSVLALCTYSFPARADSKGLTAVTWNDAKYCNNKGCYHPDPLGGWGLSPRRTYRLVYNADQACPVIQKALNDTIQHNNFMDVPPKRHNGEPYNGVNILLLWDAAIERGYQNPTWMTFKQTEEYGAHVRKGEKSSFVVYANKVTKVEHDEATGTDTETGLDPVRSCQNTAAAETD